MRERERIGEERERERYIYDRKVKTLLGGRHGRVCHTLQTTLYIQTTIRTHLFPHTHNLIYIYTFTYIVYIYHDVIADNNSIFSK